MRYRPVRWQCRFPWMRGLVPPGVARWWLLRDEPVPPEEIEDEPDADPQGGLGRHSPTQKEETMNEDFILLCRSLDKVVIEPMLSDSEIDETKYLFGMLGFDLIQRWHCALTKVNP